MAFQKIKQYPDNLLFAMFFISGFCSLLYQIVWIRLAFANFGIITPVISVIISVFMLGLSLGSWGGGKYIARLSRTFKRSPIVFYAIAEMLIGIGAFVVPYLFGISKILLQQTGESDSFTFLILSAVFMTISILPWCICMGVTFPFMMAFVKEIRNTETQSFSFLYLANVIGAMFGILITVTLLIELYGFQNTLWIAGAFNFILSVTAIIIAAQYHRTLLDSKTHKARNAKLFIQPSQRQSIPLSRVILFTTGFVSIAMEVVWIRLFTPILGTQVYAFAGPLFVYLLATWLGSILYRYHIAQDKPYAPGAILILVAITSFFPLVLNDPQIIPYIYRSYDNYAVLIYMSIFPFCAILGYLTPYLIDNYSNGMPQNAGSAYAFNMVGCIFGPLIAGYILLPYLGGKYTLLILSIPLAVLAINAIRSLSRLSQYIATTLLILLIATSSFYSRSHEVPAHGAVGWREADEAIVRRDHTATVVTTGSGRERLLLVNGQQITGLNPNTKFMAHLPLGFHKGTPSEALVICFGMGTTFRSLLSWDINVTAVELVPSVLDAFEEYHADGRDQRSDAKGNMVVDDGRRYLERTEKKYDVITIDPPPPVESAGSSLLYSDEFYSLVKKRLNFNGILQQWFPNVSNEILQAGERTLTKNFPYVLLYKGWDGYGWHYLASMSPIDTLRADEIRQKMPEKARSDLLEWSEEESIDEHIQRVVGQPRPVTAFPDGSSPLITDDRPYNEYYWYRQLIRRFRAWD